MSVIYIAGNDLNYVTSATMSGSAENATGRFNHERVQDGQPWHPYIAVSATATTYLEADLGSAKDINFCSFHGNNIVSTVTTTVRSGASPGPTTVRATFPTDRYFFLSQFVTFTKRTTDRYWRIFFDGTNAEPIAIGTWVLGEFSVLSTVQMWGWKIGYIYNTAGGSSPNGQTYRSHRADQVQRMYDMSFRAESEADMLEAKNLFEVTKYGEEPLVICPTADGDNVIHGRLVPPFKYSVTTGGLYKFNLKVIEDPIWMIIP